MTKIIITLAAVLGLSTAAFAADKKVPVVDPMSAVDLAIVSDTEYDVDAETTTTEFGVEAGMDGLSLSLLPKYDWDKSEVNNIEIGLSYDWKINKTFSIVPYAEYNVDSDFEEKGKTVGLKTRFKF